MTKITSLPARARAAAAAAVLALALAGGITAAAASWHAQHAPVTTDAALAGSARPTAAVAAMNSAANTSLKSDGGL